MDCFGARRRLSTLFIICLFFAGPVEAQDSSFGESKSFFVGVGIHFPNFSLTASESNGDVGTFPDPYYDLRIAYHMDLGSPLALAPSVGVSLIGPGVADGEGETRYITTSIPLLIKLTEFLDVQGGIGALFYMISGSGGTTTLNNGDSTLDFRIPGNSRTISLWTADALVGFVFGSLRTELGASVTGLLSDRRAVHVFGRVSWGLF